LCVEWAESRVTGRRNGVMLDANATDSNRASRRCRGVGFGGRRRGRQEDEKIWCCSEQRVVEQLGGRAGDRGFAIITLRYLIWEWIGG
jgi:hypothetical protein